MCLLGLVYFDCYLCANIRVDCHTPHTAHLVTIYLSGTEWGGCRKPSCKVHSYRSRQLQWGEVKTRPTTLRKQVMPKVFHHPLSPSCDQNPFSSSYDRNN